MSDRTSMPGAPPLPGHADRFETFAEFLDQVSFQDVSRSIESSTTEPATRALSRSGPELSQEDFAALLAPAAAPLLEEMARRAQEITRRRFGRAIQLYAPLYLSNECASICTYCGFRRDNRIARRTLTPQEARHEAMLLHEQGIRHILLLTGEEYRRTPVDYLEECVRLLADDFASVSIEVYPLSVEDYGRLRGAGVDGLAVYQETYDRRRYHEVHTGGMKKNWTFRLDCPERAGAAGMRKIALGALLGLSDPGAEVFLLGLHARFLMKRFWRSQISLSLPRLQPAAGVDNVTGVSDRRFVQYLTALRLFLPDAGLTLSTRESPQLRDNLAGICITMMSAGSRTDPGGYSVLAGKGEGELPAAGEQFETQDHRSIAEVRRALEALELEPVASDWTYVMK